MEIPRGDKDEYFKVTKNEDKTIDVEVYKLNKERDTTTKIILTQIFTRAKQKKSRLFGFAG